MKKLLIIVIEGCSLEYISRENTPNIYRIAKDGFCKCVKAAVPTINNVNHATILSGKFPCEHGVVGNDVVGNNLLEKEYIQSHFKTNTKTLMEYMNQKGASTALLSVDKEVLDYFGKGVGFGISVESAKDILVGFLGMSTPPQVESLESSLWILEACHNLIKKNSMDVVYCTTNDYMMHNYSPDSEVALEHMRKIDDWLGKIYDLDHEREIYITGGYGMNKKSHIVNLSKKLEDKGYDVSCHYHYTDSELEVSKIKPSGMVFLYLKENSKEKAKEIEEYIESLESVDIISNKEEAIKRFNLPADMIGDYLIFAADGYAFAEFEGEEMEIEELRNHGSLLERAIPLIAVNAGQVPEKYRYSRDIVKIILEKEGEMA